MLNHDHVKEDGTEMEPPVDRSRDAALVMEDAQKPEGPGVQWAIWHPGDGSQYRVKVVTIVGGPCHTDRVLLVSCAGEVRAFRYEDAEYRKQQWTQVRYNQEYGKGYNWWPSVVKPLLMVVGAAR